MMRWSGSCADESAAADAYDNILDKNWIERIIEEENRKYMISEQNQHLSDDSSTNV